MTAHEERRSWSMTEVTWNGTAAMDEVPYKVRLEVETVRYREEGAEAKAKGKTRGKARGKAKAKAKGDKET